MGIKVRCSAKKPGEEEARGGEGPAWRRSFAVAFKVFAVQSGESNGWCPAPQSVWSVAQQHQRHPGLGWKLRISGRAPDLLNQRCILPGFPAGGLGD